MFLGMTVNLTHLQTEEVIERPFLSWYSRVTFFNANVLFLLESGVIFARTPWKNGQNYAFCMCPLSPGVRLRGDRGGATGRQGSRG